MPVCGVKFCGGCNPRYDRGETYAKIKAQFAGRVIFEHAQEETEYDWLLVIGGCTNCCASYAKYRTKKGVIKIWEESQLPEILSAIQDRTK